MFPSLLWEFLSSCKKLMKCLVRDVLRCIYLLERLNRSILPQQKTERHPETFQTMSFMRIIYSCFEKGCPTEKHQSVRDNTERHDGLWLFTVASSSSRVFSAMEGGAMNTCLHVLKETKWIPSI